MVGHTHETIDQMFSRFSDKLSHNNAQTLPKLHEILRESYMPTPTVDHLETTLNYKSQYIGLRKLCGVKAPHVFRFKLDEDGSVKVAIKDWPLQEEIYRLETVEIVPAIPAILPTIAPRLQKIKTVPTAVQQDLANYRKSGRLTEEDITWWHQYLDKLQAEERQTQTNQAVTNLPVYRNTPVIARPVINSTLSEALNHSISQLQSVSEVRLGRQKITL